jgi:hypothetical protein
MYLLHLVLYRGAVKSLARPGRKKLWRQKILIFIYPIYKPVPVAARSKAYVFGRSPSEIVGLNPTGGMDVCLL